MVSRSLSRDSTPFLVGLTGGIASGKSTICEHFAQFGIVVVDADVIARQVVEPGSPALAEIVEVFGSGCLDEDGQLNRSELRDQIFAEPDKRRQLEAITHPRIRHLMWQQAQHADSPYVILAVPLLVEGGLHRAVDRVLVIDVSAATQRQRLAARDGSNPQQINQILAAQVSAETRLAVANDIIDNNGEVTMLADQVKRLHQRYLDLAGGSSDESE